MRVDAKPCAGQGSGRGARVPSTGMFLSALPMSAWTQTGWAVRWPYATCMASEGSPESQSERREDRRRLTRLTFGSDLLVVKTIDEMQLSSWYRLRVTAPVRWEWERSPTLWEIRCRLGAMASRRSPGIGMDRQLYGMDDIGQYPPVQKLYELLANCPDNLLLFFHHTLYAPYLGKTVIQRTFYDSHYDGADRARAISLRNGRRSQGVMMKGVMAICSRGLSIRPDRLLCGVMRFCN